MQQEPSELSKPQPISYESQSPSKEKEVVEQLAQLKILLLKATNNATGKESAMSIINTYAALSNSGNIGNSVLTDSTSNEMLEKLREIFDLYGVKGRSEKDAIGVATLLSQSTIKCHDIVLLGKDLNTKLSEWRAISIPKTDQFDNLKFIEDQEEIIKSINTINVACLALQKAKDEKNGILPPKSSPDTFLSTSIGTMYKPSLVTHIEIQGDKLASLLPSSHDEKFVKNSRCVIS